MTSGLLAASQALRPVQHRAWYRSRRAARLHEAKVRVMVIMAALWPPEREKIGIGEHCWRNCAGVGVQGCAGFAIIQVYAYPRAYP